MCEKYVCTDCKSTIVENKCSSTYCETVVSKDIICLSCFMTFKENQSNISTVHE